MSHRHAALHRQRGFTLSEILVTTAIFAIIMIAALAVYDQSNKVFKGSTEAADMQQSTRIGYDKLVSDLRMAGFDYNRGGTPTQSYQAPQPDEQIEYAGPTAVAFRSNFNYNSATSTGNGLETSLTPMNTEGLAIFPYVTTSNDEIVIYALRSTDSSKNTDSLSFYVDDYSPRAAFPDTITPGPAPGTVSRPERILTVGGIDTSNANPPYTLYRITDADVRAGQMGTPVAENIRSLNFRYYTDGNGATLLTNPDSTAIATGRNADGTTFAAASTGAIGGAGQYDPDDIGTTSNFADRDRRALIQSIRVDLVGMNATPDLQGYVNPTETIASIKNYREYALSSLVVPRNLGKTGFPEPMYAPPAAPTITGMCTGFCGAPVIYWKAPTGGGPVESYVISWDTSPTGTFAPPHQMTIDPSQVSATLKDVTTDDVSLTWYYRIAAINSNGSSPYSQLYTAVPKNNTKPKMTTDLHATDTSDGTAQANQITLTWTSPTDNDPSLATLSCSGTGTNTNGQTIPSVEPIAYKVYRSTVQNFTAAEAIVVLDFGSASQPAAGSPGSGVTWVDNSLTDNTPPANCVQYYYRIVAANRCRKSGTYNVSGTANDAISQPYPAWGTNAIPGSANGTGTPQAPAALLIDAAASSCSGGSGNCSIKLQWNKVTSDTAGSAIGVDTYRITRYRKHQNNVPLATYTLDTSFGTNGSLDVSGFSQMTGSTATYIDSSGKQADPNPPYAGSPYSYQYTVAAKQCSTYGAESNTAEYPSPCTVNPTIIQAGAAAGSGTGDTPADPWIFNNGDTIEVIPPGGTTLSQVLFHVTAYPAGTLVEDFVAAASPYIYGWTNRVDGQVYQVTITVTTTTGCNETHIKYVQDQTAAACAFAALASSPPVSNAVPKGSAPGTLTTLNVTYTITNGGTDPMVFHVVSPPFDGSAKVNWGDPTAGLYSDIKFTSIVWDTNTDSFSATTSPTTRTTPSGFYVAGGGGVPPATSFSMTLRYQYLKSDNSQTPLTTNPTRKLCIAYQIPSEPGTTKFCNLVGQAASTANPGACD